MTQDNCDRNDTGDPVCEPQGTPQTLVEYGLSEENMDMRAAGFNFTFQDGGDEKRNMSIHLIKIQNLKPNTKYYYRVGDEQFGWSNVLHFKTLPQTGPVTYAVYVS